MNISIGLDYEQFRLKPTPDQTKQIFRRMTYRTEIPIEQFATAVSSGQTYRAAVVDKGTLFFRSQQIFPLDFDGVPFETVMEVSKAAHIEPAVIYPTFSQKDGSDLTRFRMVFLSDHPITDLNIRNAIIQRLLELFDGMCDKKCRNATRLFYGGKPAIYTNSDNSYHFESMWEIKEDTFKDWNTSRIHANPQEYSSHQNIISNVKSSYCGVDMLSLLVDDPYRARELIQPLPRTVHTTKDAIDIMCRFPLDRFMGIAKPRSFRCPFHDDNNPSASIYRMAHSGHYLMTCHGACNRTWDIIGVTMQKFNITYETALHLLTYAFNITVQYPSADTSGYTQRLRENLSELDNLCSGPELARILRSNYTTLSPLSIMVHLTETAIRLHEERKDLRNRSGYPIFFLSVRQLQRQLDNQSDENKSSGLISSKLTLLCYLGLLERVPTLELSEKAAAKANSPECDYRKGDLVRFRNSRGNRISFYRIPPYTPSRIEYIHKQAERWSMLGYTIKDLSYQTIMNKEGRHVADSIYAGRFIRYKNT